MKTGTRLTGSLQSAAKDGSSVISLKMFLKIAKIMPLVLDVPICWAPNNAGALFGASLVLDVPICWGPWS